MKILIVEDDQNKRKSISDFIKKSSPNANVEAVLSYQSAVKKLVTENWDLLLLDMALPTYDITENEDGFQTEAFAGSRVLTEMKRKNINIPTVIVTQFETLGEGADRLSLLELEKLLANRFPNLYMGTIFYAPGESSWMPKLASYLKQYDKDSHC